MTRLKTFITILIIILNSNIFYSQNKVAVGNLQDDVVLFQLGIMNQDSNKYSIQGLKEVIEKDFSELKVRDSIALRYINDNINIFISINEDTKVIKENLPNQEYLKYSSEGLSDIQKNELNKTNQIILFNFYFPKEKLYKSYQIANEFIDKITLNRNVVLYDLETRLYYDKNFWKQKTALKSEIINIIKHINIHVYQNENEFCRAITLGMHKFGLPDICINNISCSQIESVENLINLTAQTLYEKKEIEKNGQLELDIDIINSVELKESLLSFIYENAEKKAVIDIVEGKLEEGDPDNRLIEISFPKIDTQIFQKKIFTKLFGFNDNIQFVKHNELIKKESQKAKDKLPELYKKFKQGLPTNSSLHMKFQFTDDQGNSEYMWVEIIKWEKLDAITGILNNTPYVLKNVKAGQKITKKSNEMFDYILYNPDGTQEGNETEKLLEKYKIK
ncbi:MAG: DUF2314 domain-containing protein [Limnohabitans sp.]|nr:DUF2314 domain-containing protein [Limnohabitans sp.]